MVVNSSPRASRELLPAQMAPIHTLFTVSKRLNGIHLEHEVEKATGDRRPLIRSQIESDCECLPDARVGIPCIEYELLDGVFAYV